ncbi:MAG TPA: alpha/beta hydrolase [Gallionella sp.]|nr:alpha/beta hydrolase [Gallionella sp.]
MIWETAKNTVVLGATLYGALLLALFLLQDRLVYFPNQPGRDYEATPALLNLPFESVALTSSDGVKLAAWYVPAENARGAVLYAHGNAGNISHRLDAIRQFRDMGLSVFIFDYRGYGQSTGKPSEEGTYRDAEAAWQHLTAQRGIAPAHIVIFGESLGAAVAAHLAARHQPGTLILASAFTSMPELAADLYPFIPARWLTRFHYDTRLHLNDVHAPVLIAHSREDEIIPFRHGKALYDAAHEPRQFLELRGGHNDLFYANTEIFAREVGRFLARHLTPQR